MNISYAIRRAEASDAPALTRLVRRSRAYEGRYAPMVERYTVGPDYVLAHEVHVAAAHDPSAGPGGLLGFYGLLLDPHELDLLFVADAAQGLGVGRALVTHMKERARAAGLTWVRVVSHPPAEGFYRSVGAVPMGTLPAAPPWITWERPELVFPLGLTAAEAVAVAEAATA
ncbi:GNAT family N-acetyltransferase [Streptomyces mobaraensis NBRC 13819 = DSM 40847]|uniref:GNAT family N-acetyltransferase n=2 Tax=Streptomyces mobaraensis TaxID=35621 RepID=A0A5N5WD74_STRMB|nr:GNAT family N-acetyltransferase [Streptomyces mobaraensis]EME97309.1 N-acetyltransferase GCN5 [Streptomyces mobaraensis NBRC 13819 = DSM 40847]KAB7849208.1 GNAT family N-acetyltransferase [Streptomyces mobaraensis]QTT73633.1 GNAT family N-acetyltransferase [Streptomyces mobaraensis NBRC 13819 = DSM 40847]